MDKFSKILFRYVSPSIGALIIILNSIAVYKMAKPRSNIKASTIYERNNNTISRSVRLSSSKSGDTKDQKDISNENENVKEHTKQINKAKRERIPEPKGRISKNILLLLNLAITDLIIGIGIVFSKLLFLIYKKAKNRVILYIATFVSACLLKIALLVSVANLLLLAFLRLYAIRRPMKYRTVTKKFIIKICIFLWLLISLFIVMQFFFSYRLNDPDSDIFYVIIAPYVFLAVITFSVTYLIIFKSIRTRVNVGDGNMRKPNKRGDRAFKVGSYSVIAFAACWLPISAWSIVDQVADQNTPSVLSLTCLAYLNSAVDPILYFVIYRKNF